MKIILNTFLISLILLSTSFAQSPADLYYELLDKEFRETGNRKSVDYLIREFENYVNSYPNSAQEDEVLYRLALLYGNTNRKARQFFTLLKLNLLHGKSPLQKKVSQLIDSLVTYTVEMHLSEKSEQAIKTLNNKVAKTDYRLAYLDFLSFLHSAGITYLDHQAIEACNTYKIQFRSNQDMDAVLFWQADMYNRNKMFNHAMLNYKAVRALYTDSRYVPKALFQMAQLSLSHFNQPDNATDYYIELINQYPEAGITGDAQYELARLYDSFFKDYNEALTNYKLQVQAFPENRYHGKALMRIAEIYSDNKNYSESVRYYRQIVESVKDSNLVYRALSNIKDIYLLYLNDKIQAANSLLLFGQFFPKHKDTPAHLLQAAKLYMNEIKDNNKAREILKLITDKYPNSAAAIEAEKLKK